MFTFGMWIHDENAKLIFYENTIGSHKSQNVILNRNGINDSLD